MNDTEFIEEITKDLKVRIETKAMKCSYCDTEYERPIYDGAGTVRGKDWVCSKVCRLCMLRVYKLADAKGVVANMSFSEAWVRFAAGAIADNDVNYEGAANEADLLLDEYKKRLAAGKFN
jgi:hypothetical protein